MNTIKNSLVSKTIIHDGQFENTVQDVILNTAELIIYDGTFICSEDSTASIPDQIAGSTVTKWYTSTTYTCQITNHKGELNVTKTF